MLPGALHGRGRMPPRYSVGRPARARLRHGRARAGVAPAAPSPGGQLGRGPPRAGARRRARAMPPPPAVSSRPACRRPLPRAPCFGRPEPLRIAMMSPSARDLRGPSAGHRHESHVPGRVGARAPRRPAVRPRGAPSRPAPSRGPPAGSPRPASGPRRRSEVTEVAAEHDATGHARRDESGKVARSTPFGTTCTRSLASARRSGSATTSVADRARHQRLLVAREARPFDRRRPRERSPVAGQPGARSSPTARRPGRAPPGTRRSGPVGARPDEAVRARLEALARHEGAHARDGCGPAKRSTWRGRDPRGRARDARPRPRRPTGTTSRRSPSARTAAACAASTAPSTSAQTVTSWRAASRRR